LLLRGDGLCELELLLVDKVVDAGDQRVMVHEGLFLFFVDILPFRATPTEDAGAVVEVAVFLQDAGDLDAALGVPHGGVVDPIAMERLQGALPTLLLVVVQLAE